MFSPARRTFALTLLLALLARGAAADDGLPRVEISKKGKAATALVELKARKAYGTAFCVHSSGLFLTNEHVVRGEGGVAGINLVLEPGEKTQKVLSARVIRADAGLDLALLRVEGAKDLPVLALGSDENLVELMEVIAFGFPFGTALAVDKKDYPAISVNVGSVTSLRRKDGGLHRIQLDAALNRGNSGGPVLDKGGRVIGVVVEGVQGAGVNFAIPVSHVTRFLARPDVQFTPPTLLAANLHKPALFQARAVPLLPTDKPLALELTLKAGKSERKHQMDPVGGTFRVSAPVVPAPEGPQVLRLVANYENGSLSGSVVDRGIKVGTQEVKLSDVRRIKLQPKPLVVLQDSKILEGPLSGLGSIEVRLGEQTLTVDLTKATEAHFEPPAGAESVAYTLTVTQDGKEVARISGSIAVGGIVRAHPVDPGPTGIKPPVVQVKPPTVSGDKTVLPLPSTVGDVAVGGNGRYLLLHFPQLRKLGVFDVNEAKIVDQIALAEDEIKFAAGADKLMVVLPASRLIQRWSLKTFEREATAELPFAGNLRFVCMGWASNGPLLVATAGGGGFVDVDTLKPLDYQGKLNLRYDQIRAAASGKVFTCYVNAGGGGGASIVLAGLEAKQHPFMVGNWPGPFGIQPSADGRVLFNKTLYTTEFKEMTGAPNFREVNWFQPARQGPYFAGFAANNSPNPRLHIYIIGDARPFAFLDDVGVGQKEMANGAFPFDKRFHFLPDSKAIITMPWGNDRLILHRFDPEQALDKSGLDYLLVMSHPPLTVRRADAYTYQLVVKSKKGGLKYRLESGPKGMEISEDGKLTWEVPPRFEGKEVSVIVGVRDAGGQELFHTFTIRVQD